MWPVPRDPMAAECRPRDGGTKTARSVTMHRYKGRRRTERARAFIVLKRPPDDELQQWSWMGGRHVSAVTRALGFLPARH